MTGLLVMVPTRGRRAQCERLLGSFRETASGGTDILFILDADDEDTYDGMDWGDALHAVLAPRGTLSEKLNQTAAAMAGVYDALMWTGDDHVFGSPGWDKAMLDVLGRHGRRRVGVPGHRPPAGRPRNLARLSRAHRRARLVLPPVRVASITATTRSRNWGSGPG